jgi:hypothetical protein
MEANSVQQDAHQANRKPATPELARHVELLPDLPRADI